MNKLATGVALLALQVLVAGSAFAVCPTGAPTLKDPSRGETFRASDPITFRWDTVAGASNYSVRVTPDHGATWNVAGTVTGDRLTTSLAAGDWGWEVRANFPDPCPSVSSLPSQFYVTACSLAAPQPTDPSAGKTGVANPVEFRWKTVDGATKYNVHAAVDGAAEKLLGSTTGSVLKTTLTGSKVDWRVEALFAVCPTRSSSVYHFTLAAAGCPASPGKPSLTSPADGATGLSSPVTFKWSSVSGAASYRLFASFGTGETVSLGTTSGTSLTADVPAGSGTWFVQAVFGDSCPTTISERRAFTVTSGAACPTSGPQLSSPANGETGVDSPVKFKWSKAGGAISYALFVGAGDGEMTFYGETEENELVRLVPKGTIRWAVVAKFAGCPDVASAVWSFVAGTASDCPDGTITLKTPAENAETSSPAHLSWSSLAAVEAYRVWVSVDGGSPLPILRTTATEADISLPSGEVRWFVEALKTGCPAVLSAKGRFVVKKGTACDSNPAPVPASPVGTKDNPARLSSSPVTITWNAASGAIAYRVWAARDGQPFADVALTKLTGVQLDLEPDSYSWFVEALFDGCPAVRSSTAWFDIEKSEDRCGSVAPVATLPAAGSTTTSPVNFSWTAVDRAIKYRLFASRNGDEPILLGITPETTLTRTLPPGQYNWTVEAVFEECPSVRSAPRSFTIQAAQNCPVSPATLVSPPNGATTSSPEVTFSWNPVSGAVKYVLVLEVDEGAETPVASTDKTSITRVVPAGKVEWWIVAIFPGCDPVVSDDWTVNVARSAECRTGKPLLLSPRDEEVSGPVQFAWTGVSGATGYRVWAWQGEDDPALVATSQSPSATAELAQGVYHWMVEATFAACPSSRSADAEFTAGAPIPCGTPRRPVANVVGRATSGNSYRVRWSPLPNTGLYEVQESTSIDFAAAQTITTEATAQLYAHEANATPVQYLYRVRGVSDCNDTRGPYSDVVGVFVFPAQGSSASTETGSGDPVIQKLFLPGSEAPLQFVATADKPWITVTPSQGTLPAEGITLVVTADPAMLALGTNTATVSVQYTGAAKGPQTNGSTVSSVPISVSLVTPIEPSGKGTPPPDALIFPAVAHATGANESFFESDVRLTNLTAEVMKYDVTFTPSATEGTTNGSSTSIEVQPGGTIAIDDIISSFFGQGTTSASFGTLELRPVTTSSTSSSGYFSTVTAGAIKALHTAASSRTYNFTPNGTYGQFIPAIPFADFVGGAADGMPATILSLQQVAQSSDFRANFGFVEGSGNPADLHVRVYDTASTLLATIPVSLRAGEHRQIDQMLAVNGITNLTDGRVEVEVVGGSGKVTAYVSEIDNRTNDPLMVSAEAKGSTTASRWVVPGAGFVDNGFAFWVTDLRVFNAGPATPATLTFYPMGNPGAPVTRQIELGAGEIEVIDNVLGDLFAQPNGSAGAIAVTTPAPATLSASARTYNKTQNGTYGQYIPGVTAAQSIGLGDRALQVLQLEHSSRFRTNIGVVETTGAAATVEVTAYVPDSIVTPVVTIPLAANEFRQFSLSDFNLGDAVYNARVSVSVVSGAGRVTAYGSAIDSVTQDPTYVPAQ